MKRLQRFQALFLFFTVKLPYNLPFYNLIHTLMFKGYFICPENELPSKVR